ncbi:cobalamin-dependent protein [bacterium]|nr:cobalamin-dependent protein [candidate division CSSED10-310 bacterium]
MRLLLVHPRLADNFYEDIKLPPMGLAYVAGAARQAGHEAAILDTVFSNDPVAETVRLVDEFRPDLLGLSVTSASHGAAMNLAAVVKQARPALPIVCGGVHPTILPRAVCAMSQVDYVVFGEGESTINELLQVVAGTMKPDQVDGLAFKLDGEVKVNRPRILIDDLDSLPMPAYDLLPIREYYSLQIARTPFSSMITSRGCPYSCIFCDANLIFGKRYRSHSPERVMTEVHHLVRHFGVREIMFKDSEFTLDRERVKRLCWLLEEAKLDLVWSCNSRIDRTDPEMLAAMKRAGCRLVQYGVESGDQEILDRLKKGITIDQVRRTFRHSRMAGLRTVANFMIGNPGDTRETIAATMRLAEELKPDYANFSMTVPFPGTELFRLAEMYGWFTPEYDAAAIRLDRCMMNATSIATEDLKRLHRKAFRTFYFRPSYLIKRLLQSTPHEWKMNLRAFRRIVKRTQDGTSGELVKKRRCGRD